MKKEMGKKDKAIIEQLRLMEKMRKDHEWVAVGQQEAEKEEESEIKLETEASEPAAEKPEEE